MLARFMCYAKKWLAKPGLIEKQIAVLANILREKQIMFWFFEMCEVHLKFNRFVCVHRTC